MKLAVVLFNLGGPDSLDAVEPFLENLFSDPAILSVPSWIRRPLARMIAKRRGPVARKIYSHIGGRLPILGETQAQAAALEYELRRSVAETKVFIAMRAWKPMSEETAQAVAAYAPDLVVLLPLYPQYSITTTASSIAAWRKAAAKAGLATVEKRVCCYPWDSGFVAALGTRVCDALARRKAGMEYRVLFSAHGLPQKTVAVGDPYQWQVERTVEAVVWHEMMANLDWRIAYQSRVGPLKWLEPATDAEIRRAGAEGKGLIVVPVAFVSEHSETLVELDIEYAQLARDSGAVDYIRVPTVGVDDLFIRGLAGLVLKAMASEGPASCGEGRICPSGFRQCGMSEGRA
ncbi:MAG TPA: ferrochelatase [Rhizomicrobium sp.]|nr:ferrochelatase [Rhizomicrobium sp.]